MKLVKINPKEVEKEILEEIIKALKDGKVVIFPTDTVYGILGNLENKKTVEKIFKVKKRAKNKILPVFVKDLKMAKKLAKINKSQEEILKMSWPGKITAILKRKKSKKQIFGVDKETIALRVPNFPPLNFILENLDFPLSATSANLSGFPPSNDPSEIKKIFLNKKEIDLIVDGGKLPSSKPSVILDLTFDPPKILRV